MNRSVFDNATAWPDKYKACGAPHQSPVNLSQSFALPCERLCEWKVDDTAVGVGDISKKSELYGGLWLGNFQNGKPTATFNNDGYTCQFMVLFSSSQHSLEGIFGEGELVCYFTHPSGKTVCMSVIIRSAPGETASTKFFNGFVPYAENSTTITLGKSWSLQDVIPDTPSYYIYKGTTVWPNCEPNVTWIVYSTTVTIDPSDYAKLVKVIKPARRPLEEVADRKVTYFDAKLHGISTQRDGKLYMRCRRVGKTRDEQKDKETNASAIKEGGLEDAVSEEQKENNQKTLDNISASLNAQYNAIGGIYGSLTVILLVLTSGGLFFTGIGKQVGATAFVVAFIVPHYLRAFAMWVISMFMSAV